MATTGISRVHTHQYTDSSYTDEQAQDAIGTILLNSATIDFTYDDPTPSITAIVKPNSIGTSQLSFDPATQVELDAHINKTVDAHDASAISYVATGGVSAVDVQAAITELDAEKQPLDSDLTAIAALTPVDNDIIQRKSGAWTNRTVNQFKVDFGLPNPHADQHLPGGNDVMIMGLGWLGQTVLTATGGTGIGSTITDITGFSVTIGILTTRRIKVSVMTAFKTTNAALFQSFIREDSTTLHRWFANVDAGFHAISPFVVLTPTIGTHTYKVSFNVDAGTVNHEAEPDAPSIILVEDIGSV